MIKSDSNELKTMGVYIIVSGEDARTVILQGPQSIVAGCSADDKFGQCVNVMVVKF